MSVDHRKTRPCRQTGDRVLIDTYSGGVSDRTDLTPRPEPGLELVRPLEAAKQRDPLSTLSPNLRHPWVTTASTERQRR